MNFNSSFSWHRSSLLIVCVWTTDHKKKMPLPLSFEELMAIASKKASLPAAASERQREASEEMEVDEEEEVNSDSSKERSHRPMMTQEEKDLIERRKSKQYQVG